MDEKINFWFVAVSQNENTSAPPSQHYIYWRRNINRSKLFSIKKFSKIFPNLFSHLYCTVCRDGNMGYGVFKRGVQNFCLRINIRKGNYWILRIGLMGRCQKVQNHPTSWLSKSIFYIKNYPNLSQFFFHWRISI